MATSEFFSFSLFFFLLVCFIPQTVRSVITCKESFCRQGSKPAVRFPFRLHYTNRPRCGYGLDFVLSCDSQHRTILNLPSSGRFVVNDIDYESRRLSINDPDDCLPKRFLQNFSIVDTPFLVDDFESLTFVNCSNTDETALRFESIACLSGVNFTVKVTRTDFYGEISRISPSCRTILTVMVPVTRGRSYSSLNANITMSWKKPDCFSCEKRGGDCGFTSSTGLEIGCSNLPSEEFSPNNDLDGEVAMDDEEEQRRGLPRAAKYGIILGAGIPGFLFIVGLSSCICAKVRSYRQRHLRSENISSSGSTVALASVTVVGLDEPTIESYPKTLLGASRRLPKPYDVTCSICLSEYQPEEALRTIPDCGHYFHVSCIDEWLKMNATCPLCRNSPDGSSKTSLSSPTSSSSLLSFSSA